MMPEHQNAQPPSVNRDLNEESASSAILFVDDESNVLSALHRLFRPLKYNILLASSGKEGLEIMENNQIDLVVSDMRMPEMDGATFLAKVAENWPDTVRILLTGYADMTSTIAAINEGKIYQYISKPWEDTDITLTVQHALKQKRIERERDELLGITQQQNIQLQTLNDSLEEKVEQRTKDLQHAMRQLKSTHETLKRSYVSSVKVFSSLIEMREKSMPGHSRKVAKLAHKLAINMGMSQENAQNVMVAGLLHKIGTMSLPDSILQRPYSSLTRDEKLTYQKHPVLGEAALMALEPLYEAAKFIRSHHEHFDGRGFPDGLKGDDIPLGARIITVVNDYECLINGTFSKEPVSGKQIHDFLLHNRSKRYDPEVVNAFIRLLGDELDKEDDFISLMSNGLKEGMVLAGDIVSDEGVLLLAEGQILTDSLIHRIQRYEYTLEEDLFIRIKKTSILRN